MADTDFLGPTELYDPYYYIGNEYKLPNPVTESETLSLELLRSQGSMACWGGDDDKLQGGD